MKYAVITIVSIIGLTLLVSQSAFSDDDEMEYGESMKYTTAVSNNTSQSAQHKVYQEECGSCHVAYPPGLLPQRSWQKIMDTLNNHFGDNAELPADTHQAILGFLTNNSADQSSTRRSKKFMHALSKNDVPVRITELRYFKREHREIPKRMVIDNPKVRSLSQCDRCHQDAASGAFRESRITIPGFGRWED
jgi:hypothetical protein